MKYYMSICIFMFVLLLGNTAQAQNNEMSNKKIEKILKKESSDISGESGSWQVVYGDFLLFILTDEANNRIRVFTPVIEEKDMQRNDMHHMLQANFHSALDAKYCTFEGFVISVYNHPLKELSEMQLLDAMKQVVMLADTYGTTFTSTNLTFGKDLMEQRNDSERSDSQSKKINQKPGVKM